MSVDWDVFAPGVEIDVEGVPRTLMLDHIKKAVIEFCNKSRILRMSMTQIAVTAGTDEYTLVPPAGFVVLDPVQSMGMFDGNPIAGPVDINGLTTIAAGTPDRWALTYDNQVKLWPNPSADGTFDLTSIVKPSRAATTCPDILFEDWKEPIEAYARYSLQSMWDKPWADYKAAANNYAEFRRGASRSRARALRQGRDSLVVEPRSLGVYGSTKRAFVPRNTSN